MSKVRIDVTADDIDRGERGDCGECPIALAMLRAGFVSPLVGDEFVQLLGDGRRYLPPEACDFIARFDCEWPVEPFSFELEE